MTSTISGRFQRARFYIAIQVAQVAWVGIALAVGGSLAVPSLPLYVATMVGMLALLAVAMRSPAYAGLREEANRTDG